MKFKIESIPTGLILCSVMGPLSLEEGNQCIQGVEKLLKNGKNKIVFHFTLEGAEGEQGVVFFEKSLHALKQLAKKTGGDIEYVVPTGTDHPWTQFPKDLNQVLQHLTGAPPELMKEREKLQKELQLKELEGKKLEAENLLLKDQLRGALSMVVTPQSQEEMEQATSFYRRLAGNVEEQEGAQKEEEEKQSPKTP